MGLDIYLHKVAVKGEKSEFKAKGFEKANKAMEADYKVVLKKALVNAVKYLNAKKGADNYGVLYIKRIKSLFKYFSFPQFYLNDFGVSYNYDNGKYDLKVVDELPNEEKIADIVKRSYTPSIAYWRKVNFIYAYFDNRGLLDHDSECAWVEKEDLEDIISKCDKVLEEKDDGVSDDLLPTQGGFFFGSTDYDKWYYADVKDTRKQLKKVLRGLKDDEQCYICFSW